MDRLRYLTAGESHGPALCGIVEGMPAGLELAASHIDADLARRQKGYGRGGRMKIEKDQVRILSGVRWGKTLGSPIALLIENRDYANWEKGMSAEAGHAGSIEPVVRPRPGHADLVGVLKYGHDDVRNVLERSSARETAMRVALGAVARRLLSEFGIKIQSQVVTIGGASMPKTDHLNSSWEAWAGAVEASEVRCPDATATAAMKAEIDKAVAEGYSLGGIFEVVAMGLPPGLGSYTHGDRKLTARLSRAIMGIQAIKGVEIGLGFEMGRRPGSEVMDEIFHGPDGYYRSTNHAGGLEGGMTTGMPLVLRAVMKPIPTLRKPLRSVNIRTHEPMEAAYERSDVCAVPAAAFVAEAMVALTLADALLEKFGGDSVTEIRRNMTGYLEDIRKR